VVALGKRAWNAARSFLDSERTSILNIRPVDMILMKEHVIQLPRVYHLTALLALVEVPFLVFA
jgi:hypothetical protein